LRRIKRKITRVENVKKDFDFNCLRAELAAERELNATAADLETLRESDFVSLHTLLSPETRHPSTSARSG
jgi:phosphoglycerate dehydrogenase-like enzyme